MTDSPPLVLPGSKNKVAVPVYSEDDQNNAIQKRENDQDHFAWERSKENIMPLKKGRNMKSLNKVLSARESGLQGIESCKENLEEEMKRHEAIIAKAEENEDPLRVWLNYIRYMEQEVPSDNQDLFTLIERCTRHFRKDGRYQQDGRYLKLWIGYADHFENPGDIFKFLHRYKIGTHHALFWVAWAWVAEKKHNYPFADDLYQKAISVGAKPIDTVKLRHQQFQRRMSRLWLNHNDALDGEMQGLERGNGSSTLTFQDMCDGNDGKRKALASLKDHASRGQIRPMSNDISSRKNDNNQLNNRKEKAKENFKIFSEEGYVSGSHGTYGSSSISNKRNATFDLYQDYAEAQGDENAVPNFARVVDIQKENIDYARKWNEKPLPSQATQKNRTEREVFHRERKMQEEEKQRIKDLNSRNHGGVGHLPTTYMPTSSSKINSTHSISVKNRSLNHAVFSDRNVEIFEDDENEIGEASYPRPMERNVQGSEDVLDQRKGSSRGVKILNQRGKSDISVAESIRKDPLKFIVSEDGDVLGKKKSKDKATDKSGGKEKTRHHGKSEETNKSSRMHPKHESSPPTKKKPLQQSFQQAKTIVKSMESPTIQNHSIQIQSTQEELEGKDSEDLTINTRLALNDVASMFQSPEPEKVSPTLCEIKTMNNNTQGFNIFSDEDGTIHSLPSMDQFNLAEIKSTNIDDNRLPKETFSESLRAENHSQFKYSQVFKDDSPPNFERIPANCNPAKNKDFYAKTSKFEIFSEAEENLKKEEKVTNAIKLDKDDDIYLSTNNSNSNVIGSFLLSRRGSDVYEDDWEGEDEGAFKKRDGNLEKSEKRFPVNTVDRRIGGMGRYGTSDDDRLNTNNAGMYFGNELSEIAEEDDEDSCWVQK